jgi:hypothetical protein
MYGNEAAWRLSGEQFAEHVAAATVELDHPRRSGGTTQ